MLSGLTICGSGSMTCPGLEYRSEFVEWVQEIASLPDRCAHIHIQNSSSIPGLPSSRERASRLEGGSSSDGY